MNHIKNSLEANAQHITILFTELTDKMQLHFNIIDDGNANALSDLKFIKKHIKHKVSELFFSDAIIFVEGVTEETLLNYHIDNDEILSKYYISIFNINGAHGLVYHKLIKLLKIPALIITDLDIKRKKSEKGEKYKENNEDMIGDFIQISDLNGRQTTNETIKKYKGDDNLTNISQYYENENLYIAFQSNQIEGYYATSLEEAYILQNYNNDLLNKVLKKLKPQIYAGIVGDDENRENLKHSSYMFQNKLSNSKSDFANELLYQFSIKDDEKAALPVLPEYIQNALNWLKEQLNNNQEVA
jgi:predicted ATP-dependent endonuclease of OLD family